MATPSLQSEGTPSQSPGEQWALWRYSDVKGIDVQVEAGAEVHLRAQMASLAQKGVSTWLVSPEGNRVQA